MNPVMKLENDAIECFIKRRLNRFVVEVVINDVEERAHITNTGRLEEFLVEGRKGYCYRINGGKLKYRLFAVKDRGVASLIDTVLQEKSFKYFVENNHVPWLRDCILEKHNPRLDSSIIDYMYRCSYGRVYVEVKSAVLRVDNIYAGYPDCPTLRGRRQIKALIEHVKRGGSAMIVFIAGLPEVYGFKPYDKGDPVVTSLIREASKRGVVLKSINMVYNPLDNTVILRNPNLPIIL